MFYLLRDAIAGPSHRYKSRVQRLAFVITKSKSKVTVRISLEDMSKILNHCHIRISENIIAKTVHLVNLLKF
jgi:propanediol utilization protein